MSRNLGKQFEEVAEIFLQRNSCKILEKNYQVRFGEIDLIVLDDETLAFVEVRFRSNTKYGGASYSVTKAKQQKLIKAAQLYLIKSKKFKGSACRFDVICIGADNNVEWFKSAFEMQTPFEKSYYV